VKAIKFIVILLIILLSIQAASATQTDTITAYGCRGEPGDTITFEVRLTGDKETRYGYWYTLYTPFDGDSEEMNITSWIEIEPNEYTLDEGETEVFTVTIEIPEDAKPGLYGVNSTDAPTPGHWYQRRTWVCFRDADVSVIDSPGVAAWTGFRIPISVIVVGEEPLISVDMIGEFLTGNMTYILLAVIVILIFILIRTRRREEVIAPGGLKLTEKGNNRVNYENEMR